MKELPIEHISEARCDCPECRERRLLEATGAYSMSVEDTDPARLSEQNVQVTQADRDAAADLHVALSSGMVTNAAQCAEAIRNGLNDHWEIVAAFARHRTRAEPDLVEAADFLCDRLDEIDCSSDDAQEFLRQFYGHIPAPLSRLRMAAYRARAALTRADV